MSRGDTILMSERLARESATREIKKLLEAEGARKAGAEKEVKAHEEGEEGKRTEMGRKALVPYGLYRGHGFFVPSFAKATGAAGRDLEMFWQALQQMWDLDRSSARGMMACRGLYVFSHDNGLGNAPAHTLFDLISVRRGDSISVPRSFSDYEVTIDERAAPKGISLTRLVN